MAKHLLTDRKAATARPGEKEYLLADGDGISLRVRPDGSKLWIFRYTSAAGKAGKKSLGAYPAVSLATAREEAQKLRARLAAGHDPSSAQDVAPKTIQQLFDTWVRDSLSSRRNDRGVYAVRSRLGRHILEPAGSDRIATLTRPRILSLLAPLVAAGHGPQANAVLIDVKQMLSYAAERGWIEASPAASISKASVGGRDVVRDRVLSEAEIKLLHQRLQSGTGITVGCQAAIWIALSTLARVSEIASVEEHEIDWEKREWTIPAGKNKSSREHVVHLSAFAFHWFEVMRQRPRPGAYLFPSTKAREHVKYNSFAHQIGIRQRDDGRVQDGGSLTLPGGRWTMHDLRRTGATLMGEMGVAENVVEKCLNHAEQTKLVKVYQRQKLMPQRREAFDQLGAKLTALTTGPQGGAAGDNVVPLRRAC